jgi:hypothetical protein
MRSLDNDSAVENQTQKKVNEKSGLHSLDTDSVIK